jgi:hypothetical protein
MPPMPASSSRSSHGSKAMSFRLLEIIGDQDELLERFDRFEVKLERSLTTVEAHAHADAILDSLALLPTRDRFALTVEISGDARMIGELTKRNEISEHIDNFYEDGEAIEFRIEILKEVAEQRISVYSPTAFGAYLESTPLADALTALSKRFEDHLTFECYSGTPGKGSMTLSFVEAGKVIPVASTSLAWRQRTLTLLQDNVFGTSNIGTLVPQDFAISQPIGLDALDAFMARAGATLSAMFMSNFSDLRGDQLSYRITGYKPLAGTVDHLSDLVDDTGTFQRIADWAYGAEGNSDKVGLARNVISLCVQRLEEVPDHPEIWDAIQSNYQIYLKENIATYLEVRNKLAELLAESTHKTHSLVEGLLDSIRNGVLVIMTFLLTVVVINGLKDTGVQVIFSIEYLAIAVALLVLSSLAIWASCRDARSRFEQSATATVDLLKRMYAHVMIAAELDEQVEPTIKGNRTYIRRQAKKYQIFWFVFALLVATAFLGGHKVFGKTITAPNPSSHASKDGAASEEERGERSGRLPSHAPAATFQPDLPANAASTTPPGLLANVFEQHAPSKHQPHPPKQAAELTAGHAAPHSDHQPEDAQRPR